MRMRRVRVVIVGCVGRGDVVGRGVERRRVVRNGDARCERVGVVGRSWIGSGAMGGGRVEWLLVLLLLLLVLVVEGNGIFDGKGRRSFAKTRRRRKLRVAG